MPEVTIGNGIRKRFPAQLLGGTCCTGCLLMPPERPALARRSSSMPVVRSGEVAWFSPKEKGTKPGPRSGHTITCVQEKAILFGGCGVGDAQSAVFNDTYILHIADGYRWEKVDAMGDLPHPRWRHTATTLPDNNSIFVFGGLCKVASTPLSRAPLCVF